MLTLNQQDAVAIINALTALEMYVPPILFRNLLTVGGIQKLQMIAQTPAPPAPPQMNGNGHDKEAEAKANNGQC